MAKRYRVTPLTRLVNRILARRTHRGLGAGYRYVLTVTGRRTGRPRSVPVDVMTVGGDRYLVAPYGAVAWVHNVRAASEVTLGRGGEQARYRAEEVHGADAVPVIRVYIQSVPVTRRYWEVGVEASDEEIRAIAGRHPVFRLSPS